MNEPVFPLLALSRLRMETDGPGVTTLVAGAGCPLHCRYCINKEILAKKKPEPVSPEELLRRTRVDDLYFQATGGGLCFGGGEALLHAAFIEAFAGLIGGAWKITAETALNVPEENLRVALRCVDEFIVDIKTLDPAAYKAYTGREIGPMLENLPRLLEGAGPERVKLRVPEIPGFVTGAERSENEAALRAMGFTRFDAFTYRVPQPE